MEISIRPAEVNDIPKLAEFILGGGPGVIEWLYKDALPDRPINIIVEHLLTRFGSAMDFTNWWIADIAGQPVGGVHLALGRAFSESPVDLLVPEERRAVVAPVGRLRTPDAMHIMMIYVDPENRSAGVGNAMLSKAERLATHAGTDIMSLNVRGDNPRAIELYERLGYKDKTRADVSIPTVYTGPVYHMTKHI
jgi:ribosomal protein S18 acetylase RimI-like enzyme